MLSASDPDSAVSTKALETLCVSYWHPVYAYLRRMGRTSEDAKDLTQGFLAHLIAHRSIAQADADRGSFRSYLLGALKNYLGHERKRASAIKRGGGENPLSLDALAAENSYGWEPPDQTTPETVFERRWALSVLARAMERLEEECRLAGKEMVFKTLKEFLTEGATRHGYPEAARELGLSEANTRVVVTRLRRRYGEIVRAEIADTVSSDEQARDELRHLLTVLRGR